MKRIVLSIIIYAFIIASSCPNGGREECGGELRVVRELPDITMSINDEPLFIDVLTDPPVFQQTASLPLDIIASQTRGGKVVDIEIVINTITKKRQILRVL